jgi:hypothetical protein
MSYVRAGESDSDVYVYMSTAGLICCGGRAMTSTAAMVEHLREHIADGHFPPDKALTPEPQLFAIDVKGKPNA